MKLEGWNSMPNGYSARFDLNAAPRWLRNWAAVPFIDRFAYPLLVKRGFAYLTAQPTLVRIASADEMARGWKMEDPNYRHPGSHGPLVSWDRRSGARAGHAGDCGYP